MKKQLLSLALAGAIVLSGSTLAAAAPATTSTAPPTATLAPGATSADIKVEAAFAEPTLKISVPTAVGVVLNPYELEYDIDGKTDASDPIAGIAHQITSESNVALNVSATISATPGSGMVLAEKPLTGKETDKSVFAFIALSKEDITEDPEYNAKAENQLAFAKKAVTKEKMIQIANGSTSAESVYFKVCGSVNPTPAKAWTKDDKLPMTIKFDFVPTKAAATD